MRLFAALAVVLVLAIGASACGGTSASSTGGGDSSSTAGSGSSSGGTTTDASPLVGKWIPKKTPDVPMSMDWVQFDANQVSAGFLGGTEMAAILRGSWKLVGDNQIECVGESGGGLEPGTTCIYEFTVTPDTLTLKDLPNSDGSGNAQSWVTGMQGNWTVEFTRQK